MIYNEELINESKLKELRDKIEKEVREEIAKEKKNKKSKQPKQPKIKATWDEVWKYAVWTRTYDHLEKDPRYDEWISKLEKTKQLYVDFETHTPLAVKPWELVEEEMKAANFKDIKTIYNHILIEITGKDMKGANKKDKGYPLNPKRGKIRLIQLGDKKDTYVFDVYKMTPEQKNRIGNMFRSKFFIGQNILFECKFICEEWGPTYLPAHCYDTMTIEKLICCSELAYLGPIRFDLQSIAQRRARIFIEKGYGDSDWGNPDLSDEQINYAEEDIDVLRPIVKAQLPKLKAMGNNFVHIERDVNDLKFLSGLKNLHLIAAIECDVIPCFARMMHAGIPVNTEVLEEKSKNWDKEFEEVCNKLGFNINSNPQTLKVLVDMYHLNISGSSADDLAPYYNKYEVVKDIVDGRSIDTINGLLKGYLEASRLYGDNRVHPNFTVYQAYSGRTACKNPNAQQVPRELKPVWMKPRKGKIILNLDLPGIELRLGCSYCKENKMIKAFREGLDLHKMTAAAVCHCSLDEVTKDMRKKGKAINFGYIYGCSSKRFKQTAMTKFQIDYPLEECEEMRSAFFKQWDTLDRHVRRMYKLFPYGVSGVKYVVKTFLGRKMMCDGATNALNFPIQGSCADAIKMSIVYFYHLLRTYKGGKYNDGSIELISMVHDELFVEAPIKKLKFVTKLLKKSIECGINYIMKDFFLVKVEPEISDYKGEWRESYSEEELNSFINDLNKNIYTFEGLQKDSLVA